MSRRRSVAHDASSFGRRVGGDDLGLGELGGQESTALGAGVGKGEDAADRSHFRSRRGHQLHVDVENDLALDEELDIEDQAVDDGVHGAFDGVLDGDEGQIGRSVVDGVENLGEAPHGKDRARGVVGLGEAGLLR